MSWGKFGLVINDEFNWNEGARGSKQEYDKLRSNYASNRNPKFNNNGIIESVSDKFGNTLPKDNIENKKFIGAKVLYNIKMQDCEVGMNYSNAIKDGKINPRNPLYTHKIGKSQYGKSTKKTKYTSILLSNNDLKIIMK